MIEAFGDRDFAFENYSRSSSLLFVSELRCHRRNFFLAVYPDTKKRPAQRTAESREEVQ